MKYFLDSAKIDEIREAYDTFGIDGITTNPNHIMNSGKPFYTVIAELADFVKEKGIEGWEVFPISVEINPHLDNADEMVEMARKISGMCKNLVIKIPCTEAGIAAARRLETEGIRNRSVSGAVYPHRLEGKQRRGLRGLHQRYSRNVRKLRLPRRNSDYLRRGQKRQADS